MKKILTVTTNFGLGPVSKLYSIIKKLEETIPNVSITFCGSNEAISFLKQSLDINIAYIDEDTDAISQESFLSIAREYDFILNVMNFHVQDISMNNIRSKEIFVDSLNWLWPDSIAGIDECLVYFMQRAFPSFGIGFKTKNMVEIDPIVNVSNLKIKNNERIKEILINVAGVYVPNKEDKFSFFYLEQYLKILFKLKLMEKYKIVVACNKRQKKVFENKLYTKNVVFKIFTHDLFLKESQIAYKVFSTSGLTFYLESRRLGLNVHYLLPSNYSQALLLEKYKEFGRTDLSISSFGDEYNIPNSLEEDYGVELTRKIVKDIFDKYNDKVCHEIKLITADCMPDSILNTETVAKNGAKQVADFIKEIL
ncbi:hypothetical protein HU830_06335 [Lactobacillus sp. DCY120]|uniref:Uncharacterized protein n=1 Tax=Bombilactobacillus apium TaxID=2675299 RepID=A0A850R7V0_9LACO|nr:hypothetical protein [Bombilactobacillus apium]NVY96772.1 hypothetical protein [Bombilactobacillus apium]